MARSRMVYRVLSAVITIAMLGLAPGCGPSADELRTVDYTPLQRDDWDVATPEQQGLDPDLVARLYYDASRLDTVYSMLVVKDGRLIAEQYFNGASVDDEFLLQSASKSYVSALVGIALREGYLESLDRPFVDYFPDEAERIQDPRKREITIRELLQMRSGYPWEETDPQLFEAMLSGDNPPLIVDIALTADPGTTFQYSNSTSAWLAAIVTTASGMDLKEFTTRYLAEPIGAETGELWANPYDDFHPLFHVTARDAAKFGQLYLQGGSWEGTQVVPAEWVEESLGVYSEDCLMSPRFGREWSDYGYGYQWWSANVGGHHVDFAWGHGGQLIALIDEFDMVIVMTSDPFFQQHDGESWKNEKANLAVVGEFIASLPSE